MRYRWSYRLYIANRRTVNVVTQRFTAILLERLVYLLSNLRLILAVHLFTGIIR